MSSFSVIIPSYNYGRYLAACVDNVLSQKGVETEILIIDDCSSDDTARIGQQLAAADDRVTFLRHEINRGHLLTYNEGLDWASAPYTVLLSVDDLLTPDSLRRAADVLDAHPEVGMVYGRSLRFEHNDTLPAPRPGPPLPTIWKGRDWIAQRCQTATNCVSSPEVVVRTELQQALGGYRADLPHSGDLEMWLRFAAHADVAVLRHVDQAYYRVHAQSMARTTFADPLDDLRQRQAAFDTVLLGPDSPVPQAGELLRTSHQALAREALRLACRVLDRGDVSQRADRLESFALEVYPDAKRLPAYQGLRWRRRVAPHLRPWWPTSLAAAASGRIRSRRWWWRWNERGV